MTSKLKSHEQLKLDVASMSYGKLVIWEKEEPRSPYLRTPPLKPRRKDGHIDVGGSSTACDWLDERVGYDGGSLPAISKDGFSNDVVLDAGGSFSATSLSIVLKKKGKSRVNFTRKRAILKRLKMLSLRKGVGSHKVKGGVAKRVAGRSNYGSLGTLFGLNEDEGDDDPQLATQLSQTGDSSNNYFKDVD
ncbi:hypothetical protein Tco_1391454 [Tanacetum coccineum]